MSSVVGAWRKSKSICSCGDPAIKYIPKEAEIVKGDLCDIDSLENFFKAPEGTETIVSMWQAWSVSILILTRNLWM